MGCYGSKGASEVHASNQVPPVGNFVKEEPVERPTDVASNYPREFKAVFRRTSDNEKLGMRLAPRKTHLLVKELKDLGLALTWNAKEAESPHLQIRPGDIIMNVNGVIGNSEEMMKQFGEPVVNITVMHPVGMVFVNHLDSDLNDSSFHAALSAIFENSVSMAPDCSSPLNIASCKVLADSDGKSRGHGCCRGHGFVYFQTQAEATRAAELLNGAQVGCTTVEASVVQDGNLAADHERIASCSKPDAPQNGGVPNAEEHGQASEPKQQLELQDHNAISDEVEEKVEVMMESGGVPVASARNGATWASMNCWSSSWCV